MIRPYVQLAVPTAKHVHGTILLCACLLFMSGCSTTDDSGTGSMASVVISGTSVGVVSGAAIDVFEGQGFELARRDRETLVFEKPGSSFSNLAYGNWTESKVWNRIKVFVETVGESTVRLSATGYLVRDKGGATEEQLRAHRRGPYQKLLDEVANRFKAVSAAGKTEAK